MTTRIGKIQSIKFGFGGYQDAQIGLSITLGSNKDCWGVSDFRGHWADDPTDSCKWTAESRNEFLGEMCLWIRDLLTEANKINIDDLIGVPVKVTFDGNALKSWRILTEVI